MSVDVVFSVVVATYQRIEPLDRLLAALAAQQYPAPKFEVVVVDDGGGAPIKDIVRPYESSLNLRLFAQTNGGPAAARNLGASRAKGRFVAFTDDDCAPDPGWLAALERAFATAPEAAIGGALINGVDGNLYSEASELLVDYLYLRYSPTQILGGFFLANNLTVPREAFLAAGGFDASMRYGEDREFCHRWAAHGGAFRHAPEAVVRHYNVLRLFSFARLHYRYGGGTALFRDRLSRRGLPTATMSPPGWYVGLVLHGMRRRGGWRGVALTALLAMSQACSMAGLFRTALTNRALIR
jgi:glycosyltransferase involved in cell wall biosynthesis